MHVDTALLSDSDRLELLKLVRQSAEIALGNQPTNPCEFRHLAGSFGGVFVTFWRDGHLRGCVGSLSPTADVMQTLPAVTQSALKDRRFVADPIRLAELERLIIEVSLLSDMERITGSQEVEIGRHGILVRRQSRSGCFLPKVAVEQGWNSEQFLTECCARKAGLPPDAWRDPQCEFFRFTAIVVSESKTAPKSKG